MEHGPFCNCEDCWWAHGQREVCSSCGCVHEENDDGEEGNSVHGSTEADDNQ